MNDSFLMCMLNCTANRFENSKSFVDGESFEIAELGKWLATDQLHDDKCSAILGSANVEDARDPFMIHCSQSLPLDFETLTGSFIKPFGPDNFYSYIALNTI
nr:hypothetical protein [Mariniblastus fucicola]